MGPVPIKMANGFRGSMFWPLATTNSVSERSERQGSGDEFGHAVQNGIVEILAEGAVAQD